MIRACGIYNKQQAQSTLENVDILMDERLFNASEMAMIELALHEIIEAATQRSVHDEINKVNVSASFSRDMSMVHDKKHHIQNIAKTYADAKNAPDEKKRALYEKSKYMQAQVDSTVEAYFNHGKATYARTLSLSNDEESEKAYGTTGKTPAKREMDTLRNKIKGIDIAITPSSLLHTSVKAKTISQMKEPLRPKWMGLPTVIYSPREGKVINSSLAEIHHRPGFGDVHSFASNKAFDEEYRKKSPTLSHAEKINLIESKLWQYTKPDPGRQNTHFLHSIDEMVTEMAALQKNNPQSPLRHNEYCARLEAWDARALEIGSYVTVAIASMIEFNIEMHSLAKTLNYSGTETREFNDFLQRQLSWSGDKIMNDLNTTNKKLGQLSDEDKKTVLNDICDQLRQGISLCTYEFNAEGSKMRALSMQDFSLNDIQNGIEKFLSSKLYHLP